MSIDPHTLEGMNRDELIAKARQLGAQRAELLTRPELRDEIIRLSAGSDDERRRARGWFGVARDLVASVVGQGLNLPDTADLIRGVHVFTPKAAAPVATVTLAEIYAAQGHVQKALDLLDEVLEKEPDHEAARRARERWAQSLATREGAAVDESPSSDDASSEVADEDGFGQTNLVSDEDADMSAAGEPILPQAAVAQAPEQLPSTRNHAATEVSEVEPAGAAPAPLRRREPVEDRLVVLRGAEASLLCDWELTQKTIERLRAEEPTGVLTLRTLEIAASWDGPVTHQHEIELSEMSGHSSVVLSGAGNELRVALGWRTEQRFIVLALGAEFGWSEASGASLRWAPPHTASPEVWQRVGGAAVARLMQDSSPS